MIGTAESFGALTIINGIGFGKGAAFGIHLKTSASVELIAEELFIIETNPATNPTLAEVCGKLFLETYSDEFFGAVIKTESEIPPSMGLKSSSSVANAILFAAANALSLKVEPLELLRLGAKAAILAGASITGAFDDACACHFGGLCFTDNQCMELLMQRKMPEDLTAVIHLPDFSIPKSKFPTENLRSHSGEMEKAYEKAVAGNIFEAMQENGRYVSRAANLSMKVSEQALLCGAVSAGVSGTGPATGILVPCTELDKFLEKFGCENLLIRDLRNGA